MTGEAHPLQRVGLWTTAVYPDSAAGGYDETPGVESITDGSPMDVRYHLDPDTQQPHIYGHGVTEAEVEYILRHAGEDKPGRDNSRHALGQTAAGRHLRVIYVPDDVGDGVFVVTAYDLRGKPLQAYRRRQRRRP